MIRDSINRDGGTLEFSAETWQTFADGIKQS